MVADDPAPDAVDLIFDVVHALGSFRNRGDERLATVVLGDRIVRAVVVGPDVFVVACEREVDAPVVPDDLRLGLFLLAGLVPAELERPDRGRLLPRRLVEDAVHDHPAPRLHGGVLGDCGESGGGCTHDEKE